MILLYTKSLYTVFSDPSYFINGEVTFSFFSACISINMLTFAVLFRSHVEINSRWLRLYEKYLSNVSELDGMEIV